MTGEELQVVLNLRATLSEYEVFMTQLSAMIDRGVDIPCIGTVSFPMREKLYKQVRDLVLGYKRMDSPIKPLVGDIDSPKILRDLEVAAKAKSKEEPFVNLLRVGDNVWWSEGDSKLIGNIQSITNDGLTADVICPDGTRMCVATKILHYDGK